MHLFTIGFTQKSAEQFFSVLLTASVRRIIDVRLNNISQLAGFTKRTDLPYFLKAIGNIDYVHLPILAPTQAILDAYKKRGGGWQAYEESFLRLMEERHVEDQVSPSLLDGGCLLCSEPTPEHCHRRLVAEYLNAKWERTIEIHHL